MCYTAEEIKASGATGYIIIDNGDFCHNRVSFISSTPPEVIVRSIQSHLVEAKEFLEDEGCEMEATVYLTIKERKAVL